MPRTALIIELWRDYALNAVVGSSPAARRAGSHDDTAAITKNTAPIAANVSGSVGLTPTSIVVIAAREGEGGERARREMPAALSRSPWPTTSRRMRSGDAPSAMRTPISAVRWRTTVASTP